MSNDSDTKREKMTSVCFGLPWPEIVNKIMADFEQDKGTNLKLKSASLSGTERSEILNNGTIEHIKTLFNESFSLVVCNRCYTALCQFSNGTRA